jgi:hypothetical protein
MAAHLVQEAELLRRMAREALAQAGRLERLLERTHGRPTVAH